MTETPSSPFTRRVPPRHVAYVLAFAMLLIAGSIAGVRAAAAQEGTPSRGWRIPPGAADEANPVPVSDTVIQKGRQIFQAKCQRCHGPAGNGDGPDADPDHMPQDLTDASRAPRNPDGVMFYKIWNGRASPKMPAFSTELQREDVWTVIHYVKTLRAP